MRNFSFVLLHISHNFAYLCIVFRSTLQMYGENGTFEIAKLRHFCEKREFGMLN